MSSIAAVLGMLLVFAGLSGTSWASDEPDRSVLYQFRCDGFGAFIPVDADTVRRVGDVPGEFDLQGPAAGRTILFVAAFACDFLVDGKSFPQSAYSNVTVNLDSPPDVCRGCGAGGYDIWQFTDEPFLHSLSARTGVFQPLVRDMSVSIDYMAQDPDRLPISGRAVVPWEKSPYVIAATIPPNAVPLSTALDDCSEPPTPTTNPGGCFSSNHWHKGPQGIVYTAHANCNILAGGAAITVETAPGTALAQMLGGTTVHVPGGWLRFDGTALMDSAERFALKESARPPCTPIARNGGTPAPTSFPLSFASAGRK